MSKSLISGQSIRVNQSIFDSDTSVVFKFSDTYVSVYFYIHIHKFVKILKIFENLQKVKF